MKIILPVIILFGLHTVSGQGQTTLTPEGRNLEKLKAEQLETSGEPLTTESLKNVYLDHPDFGKLPIGIDQIVRDKTHIEGPSIYEDPDYLRVVDELLQERSNKRIWSERARSVGSRAMLECVAVGNRDGYAASGVILQDGYILTAAHIWDGVDETAPDRVWLGSVTPDCDDRDADGEKYIKNGFSLRVDRFYRHKKYMTNEQGDPVGNDLMLLKLDSTSKAKVTVHASPISAAQASELGKRPWLTIRAVGFGHNRSQGGFLRGLGIKRWASIPVLRDAKIKEYGIYAPMINDVETRMEIVAASTLDGTDTCEGDSGGGIFVVTEDGSYLLAGITSRRVKNATRVCGQGGIYVNLGNYLAWIEEAKRDPGGWRKPR